MDGGTDRYLPRRRVLRFRMSLSHAAGSSEAGTKPDHVATCSRAPRRLGEKKVPSLDEFIELAQRLLLLAVIASYSRRE